MRAVKPFSLLTRSSVGLAVLLGILCVSGCGKPAGPEFAFVTNGVDPFWTLAESGAKAAAAERGLNVKVLMPAGGAVEQKNMLEDLLTRGVTGVAVSPIDAANQVGLLDEVASRAILITHDSDAPQSARRVFIGVDNYDAGRMCGQLVKEALPDGGRVMIFIGRLEQDNAKLRRQGVIDELLDRPRDPSRFDPPGAEIAGGKYVILGTLTDNFDRARAKANAEDTLSRHPDVGCMVGLFAYNPPAILEALEQAGKVGAVKVAAFDEQDRTLQGIRDGHVQGTVVQNPYEYGARSVAVLQALAAGDESVIPESKVIHVPARQIRKDNVDAFWAEKEAMLGGAK
jgi:ribose transport system substrate-binding protein